MVKNPFASAGDSGDLGSIPRLGRSPGEGDGNPLQYSCLGYSMGRGAWRATVYGIERVRHNQVTNSFSFHIGIYLCSFYILFHYRLLQYTEYSFLCYTVGPSSLSALYIEVCICNPKFLIYSSPFSSLLTISLCSMSVSLFLFCK